MTQARLSDTVEKAIEDGWKLLADMELRQLDRKDFWRNHDIRTAKKGRHPDGTEYEVREVVRKR